MGEIKLKEKPAHLEAACLEPFHAIAMEARPGWPGERQCTGHHTTQQDVHLLDGDQWPSPARATTTLQSPTQKMDVLSPPAGCSGGRRGTREWVQVPLKHTGPLGSQENLCVRHQIPRQQGGGGWGLSYLTCRGRRGQSELMEARCSGMAQGVPMWDRQDRGHRGNGTHRQPARDLSSKPGLSHPVCVAMPTGLSFCSHRMGPTPAVLLCCFWQAGEGLGGAALWTPGCRDLW